MGSDACPIPISIIDEEHRGIQREIVNLIEAILVGAGYAKVLVAAKEVLRVTLLHFEHEEEVLRAIKFPSLQRHREEHAAIAGVLERVTYELKNEETAAALRSIREYRKLLLVHLQTEDERYRDELNRYAKETGMSPLPQRIRHAIPES